MDVVLAGTHFLNTLRTIYPPTLPAPLLPLSMAHTTPPYYLHHHPARGMHLRTYLPASHHPHHPPTTTPTTTLTPPLTLTYTPTTPPLPTPTLPSPYLARFCASPSFVWDGGRNSRAGGAQRLPPPLSATYLFLPLLFCCARMQHARAFWQNGGHGRMTKQNRKTEKDGRTGKGIKT